MAFIPKIFNKEKDAFKTKNAEINKDIEKIILEIKRAKGEK